MTKRTMTELPGCNRSLKTALAAAALSLSMGLAGCGLSEPTDAAPAPTAGIRISGSVYGGQQAITGASVQLYAAGSTVYGTGYPYTVGTSLLGNNVVTTQAGGRFSLANDFTCPTPAPVYVYLVVTGGNPGLSIGTNPNLALMAALGRCDLISSNTSVVVNEMTTVASVWALAPFMTGTTAIGSSAANANGLLNAFAAVNKLANIATGSASGPALPANATLPVAKLNTLADALAACVNSSGGSAGQSNGCGYLFTAATINGVAPTDTVTAAMNIAQHPGNIGNLLGIVPTNPPFQPVLSGPPNDWTIAINYTGGLSTPKGLALDASGNVWIANSGNNSVTELSNTGAVLSGSGYTAGPMNAPSAIAIDASGNAWVANGGNSSVTELNPSGTTGTLYTGSFNKPSAIAIDALGDAWVANNGNSSVTLIGISGTMTQYTGSGLAAPVAIAIDPH